MPRPISCPRPVLMCQNCGHIDFGDQFGGEDGDYVPCPVCGVDAASQLHNDSFDRLVPCDHPQYEEAKEMVKAYHQESGG